MKTRARSRSAVPRSSTSARICSRRKGCTRARYKGNDVYGINMGGTEEGYAAGGTTMKLGRFFTDEESRHHMPVVVIGEEIQKQLLPNADPDR